MSEPTNTLTPADEEVIREVLVRLRDSGAEPLLPLDVDLDGDGIVDAWGLNAEDRVVLVSGCSLAATCYVSDGDDIRAEVA